jgi:hypothetical protein
MMRDDDADFNNTTNPLNTTSLQDDFVRYTKGIGRTSVVDFVANEDGTDKSVVIQSFDSSEFNSAQAPVERMDLVYIKASNALDTDLRAQGVPLASVGIVKGAYFRTDPAAGIQANGSRFESDISRLAGRITGMAGASTPRAFGSVPSPEDLTNFAWHHNQLTSPTQGTWDDIITNQTSIQAGFNIPVAYVRVPQGYTEGQPIDVENIIDIRPFFRTAELSYNERAAILASSRPNGSNPFVTESRLVYLTDILSTQISQLSGQINAINGILDDHEQRITNLEQGMGSGGGGSGGGGSGGGGSGPTVGAVGAFKFLATPYAVFYNQKASQISPGATGAFPTARTYIITNAIAAADRNAVGAVQFRVYSRQIDNTEPTFGEQNLLYMRGGVQEMRLISAWGISDHAGTQNVAHGNVNTFYADVFRSVVNGQPELSITVKCQGTDICFHDLYIDGYIS